MAETATGEPWRTLMKREVFEPLGMESVGFGSPPGVHDPWAHPMGTPVEVFDNPQAIGPAGTLHLTLADWAVFAQLHLTRGRSHPGYLTPETFSILHRAQLDDYAMGWGVDIHPEKGTRLAHAGSNTGWYARIELALEAQRGVLVVVNAADDESKEFSRDVRSSMRSWKAPGSAHPEASE